MIGVSSGVVTTIGALMPSHPVLAQMGIAAGAGGLIGKRYSLINMRQLQILFNQINT